MAIAKSPAFYGPPPGESQEDILEPGAGAESADPVIMKGRLLEARAKLEQQLRALQPRERHAQLEAAFEAVNVALELLATAQLAAPSPAPQKPSSPFSKPKRTL